MQDNQEKQLFTELTSEEGAAVSGGAQAKKFVPQEGVIQVNNKTDLPVYLDLDFGDKRYQDFRLGPGKTKYFSSDADKAIIDYDKDYGKAGIQPQSYTLRPYQKYNFSLSGSKLNLYSAGAIA